MASTLAAALATLDASLQRRLNERQFDAARFLGLAARVADGQRDNRVRGNVTPPAPGDVVALPVPGSSEWRKFEALGLQALARGECALCVLAGGMATRMGSVVKALVPALPGATFLELRLAELDLLSRRAGRPVPLWLMTSEATDGPIRDALGARLEGEDVATFRQCLSLRLTASGELYVDAEGRPSEHAPGHGDLPDALRKSGLVQRFVERGGRHVMITNLDNLGATLDPVVVGAHIAHGLPVTCEVVDKVGSDRGGIPARHDGRPVVLEEFRLPAGFDAHSVRVFNTNTFHVDARSLASVTFEWSWFVVEKQVDGHPVVQFERLLGEITSHLDTRFLRVPRAGEASRFLPVKDPAELEARRPEIELSLRSRGIVR